MRVSREKHARNAVGRAIDCVPMTGRIRLRAICAAMSVVIGSCVVTPAHAFGLADAYEAALSRDPVYAAAKKERDAGEANRAIGRSYLLPSVSANYANYRDWTRTSLVGQPDGGPGGLTQQYRAYTEGVSLRQPLLNYEGLARYRYGKAQALASDATFTDNSEDLLVRVLSAYTDTIFALDQVALASAQKTAFDEQLRGNESMFANGQGTRTDILETRSKAALAEADLEDARDNLDNAAHALEAVTGLPASLDVDGLDRLSDAYRAVMPAPASFDQWRDMALDGNAELIAGRHSVEAARQQREIARAGFLPRVDVVASLGRNQSDSLDTIGQRYLTKSIGIEITIPLYSGGLVKASTDQAGANYERAQYELEDKTNKVLLDVRKQYNLCVSSLARIDALQRASASATLLIAATKKSVQAGVRTNLDVLTAEQQLFQSKRDLARARYQYLIADLQLRHAVGSLTADDLYDMAKWFVPPAQVATAMSDSTSPTGFH
ncbi:TolC family type I secretion outer membrane protein [Caballeronia udeis]|uniref:TolC family type I secretion outer membrane protein n=1 Tax=Caballeronia udeis TaxID=1232866 RepID=A0A158EY03_9BURK|nr:TolC family type I secretion outer membrane protein [Caballeronia udeis]